jgi:uncharacterized protein YprB with RNaseH-like and TPR domain
MVCASIKFHDEDKVRTVYCRWYRQEKKMLEKIQKWWDKLDVVVTVNGKMFDLPFVNARMMHHGLLPLHPEKMHVDLRWQGKKLRFRGASLDGMAKDLRLINQKYDLPAWRWVLAAEGDMDSIKEIIKHCERDVRMTEELFNRLKPVLVRITK